MGRGILLWLLGVPIPVILLLVAVLRSLTPVDRDRGDVKSGSVICMAGPDFLRALLSRQTPLCQAKAR